MLLTDDVIKKMRVMRTFTDNRSQVSCIDMLSDGSLLVISSSQDKSMTVFSFPELAISSFVANKRYGLGVIRIIDSDTVIHSCTMKEGKDKDYIRMLALNEKKYIRSFIGHTDMVCQLAAARKYSMFISSAIDGTSLVWDSRVDQPQFKFDLQQCCLLAFGYAGDRFAAVTDDFVLRLFDVRNYVAGPYVKTDARPAFPLEGKCTSLSFSLDDRFLLINTDAGCFAVFDTLNGNLLRVFTGCKSDSGHPVNACFMPENHRIFSGSTDGNIYVWNMDGNRENSSKVESPAYTLPHPPDDPPICTMFHPTYALFASAGKNTYFWLPDVENAVDDS